MTTIDLFSGCGGMTLGFKWAGFESLLATDIDHNCELSFTHNFPDTPFICEDVSALSRKRINDQLNGKSVDVILGGPPCQGFSLANKRRNKVKDDPRNKLFYGFVNMIDWVRPKAFVMENVKGILSMQKGAVFEEIIASCENAGDGYEVRHAILRASDYGVPQSRERVIIVGIRKDLGLIPQFPEPSSKKITVDQAIMDLPQIKAAEGEEKMQYAKPPTNDYQRLMRRDSKFVHNHIAMRHTKRLVARFEAIEAGQNLLDVWETHGAVQRGAPDKKSTIKFSQNNQRLHGNKPAPTIAASFQSNFIHPHLNRNFTAREGARLQSFPDDFIFKGMRTKMSWEKGLSQYQQIGNAVPPLLAMAIAETLKKQLSQKS